MTFSFTLAWKEFLYALVLTTSPSEQTVTIGIANFRFSDQGLLMSPSVIASIPTMFLYLLSQKFMIGGFTAESVKIIRLPYRKERAMKLTEQIESTLVIRVSTLRRHSGHRFVRQPPAH